MIEVISRLVTRWPTFVLLLLISATALGAYHAVMGLSLRVVLEEMLPVYRPNVQVFARFAEQFGGANTTLIVIESQSGDIYNSAFLEKYKRISDEIYFHPSVVRHLVQSVALRKTKVVTGTAGRVEIEALMWPKIPQSAEEMATFRAGVREQYRGFLVSDDEKSAVIIADFKDDANFQDVLKFLEDMRQREEGAQAKIFITGRPVLLGLIYDALGEVGMIVGLSLLLIVAVLYLYFHCALGVIVPLLTATIVMVWGAGVVGYVGYGVNPLLVLLPAFVFAIVLSHTVQLTSRVLEEWNKTNDWRLSVEIGLKSLLYPSAAAIVTDAAGFLVLFLVWIPSIQSLALICTAWLLTIWPALIMAAALLARMKPPAVHRIGLPFIGAFWHVLALRRLRYLYLLGAVALAVVAVDKMKLLEIGDAKGSAILWQDSRFNRDFNEINAKFSRLGADVMQVYVEGDKGTMLLPAVYRRIEALDRYVYEHMAQGRPAQSLVGVIKKVNEVVYEGDPSYAIIPNTPEEVGLNLYLFRSRGEPGDFVGYSDNDWKRGSVSFFFGDHAAGTVSTASATVDRFVKTHPTDKATPEYLFYTGGQIGITEALNDEVERANILTSLAIVAIVAFCVVVYYRSFAVAGIMMFGVALSNLAVYAYMATQGIGLSVNTLPLASLGVGLGVDFSIYFADRVREEFDGVSIPDSVKRAFLTSGSAIVMTALAMIIPLLPWWIFSPLRFQAEMGMLLAFVLALSTCSALIYMPVALMTFRPRALFVAPAADGAVNRKLGHA